LVDGQRGAPWLIPWRIATLHHATLRVAPHRYATCEPPGHPSGSRAFSADGPSQAPLTPRQLCEANYMRGDEFAGSRRAVIERLATDPPFADILDRSRSVFGSDHDLRVV
jgi:hypothetical protein